MGARGPRDLPSRLGQKRHLESPHLTVPRAEASSPDPETLLAGRARHGGCAHEFPEGRKGQRLTSGRRLPHTLPLPGLSEFTSPRRPPPRSQTGAARARPHEERSRERRGSIREAWRRPALRPRVFSCAGLRGGVAPGRRRLGSSPPRGPGSFLPAARGFAPQSPEPSALVRPPSCRRCPPRPECLAARQTYRRRRAPEPGAR